MLKKCNLQNPLVAVIIFFGKSGRINDLKIYHAVKCSPEPRRRWIAPEVYDETGRQTVHLDICFFGGTDKIFSKDNQSII